MVKARIEAAVKDALEQLGVSSVPFVVERPRTFEYGDYATNAALVAKMDAGELAAKLKIERVEKVEVVGKFINFFLSREALLPHEENISQIHEGKTVLVEYTSPNLFKPLHIGNLVGNILGESIARLFEVTGATVKRLNYPSDIGLTVAKGVWGLQKNALDPTDIVQLGKAYVAGNSAYEDGSAKEKIDEINTALYENSDSTLSELRRKGIETSRKHLDALCARLGTTFDKEFFESESGPIGAQLVRQHIGGVFEESEGAVVYRGAHTRVFLNSKGLPTYEAKELGLFKLKTESYPDFGASYTVTGSEQKDFFSVVFEAVCKVFPAQTAGKELAHIANGFLRLTTGKMSSRLGNVITGESLIEDLRKAARDREDVAIGAIKYAVLKQGSSRDIIFDPEKSLSLEGDSGPYVQYAHTRALSLIREAEKAGIKADTSDAPAEAHDLERLLIHYPDVVVRAAQELEPHYVTTYVTELASAFNSWYASERVIGGAAPHYGVLLAQAVEQTLKKGLTVLGIPAPDKM